MSVDKLPGAQWLRCDLHVHTPFDGEKKFGEDIRAAIDALKKADTTRLSEIAERFVRACIKGAEGQGIDVVALTDHNSVEGYKRLSPFFESIAQRLTDEGESIPAILPGVEFSVGGERPIHFLVIFAKSTQPNDIEGCIRYVFGDREPFDPSAGTPRASGQSVDDFLKKLYGYCHPSSGDRQLSFVVLPAHADGSSGLAKATGAHLTHGVAVSIWDEMKGHLRQWVITRQEWHGFQTNRPFSDLPEEFKNLLCRWLAARRNFDWDQASVFEKDRIRQERHWPLIETSDPHNYEQIGSRYTWIKMELPDVEGIRLALLDPQSRLRRMVDGPPGADYPIIRRLTVHRTDFFENFDIALNPCLNTLIGGRGSGKTTAIECLRFVLDRARNKDFDIDEDEIQKMVESFLHQKPARDYGETEGTLLPNYGIATEVLIAGRLYRIIRDATGIQVIPDPDRSDAAPQPLDVRTLLSPRILSQRQIARIARDPAAQRRELDALCPREETQAFEEKHRAFLEEIERLQFTRRKLKERRAKLPSIVTESQKIKDQIAFLEQGGNKEILERYRAFQSEQVWLEDTFGTLLEALNGFSEQKQFLDEIKDRISVPPDGPNQAWMEGIAEKVREAIDGALKDLGRLGDAFKALHEALANEQSKKWKPGFDNAVDGYKRLEKEMKEKGVQFDQHEKLLQQRAFLEKEIKRLQGIDKDLHATEKDLKDQRERLVLLHEDRIKRRRALAETLEREDADVRLEIVPFGDRDHFASQREAWFAGAGLQVRDWEVLVEFVYSQGNGITERLAQIVGALRKDIEVTEHEGKAIRPESSEMVKLLGKQLAGNLTRNYYNALVRSDRIYLDKMEQFLPEDRVEARVREADGIFKPITQGSIGQRSTAILSLLLSAGDQPLIIDQPEDDLDNQYIYEVVVGLLRKRKFSRQIIIATHNANIPVNGDAELIVALDVQNRLGRVLAHGSIDRSEIKDQVSRIMEGSAEAFRLRKERYGY